MIDVPRLRDRDRWERVVDGWTDNTHDDAVTHTVRIVEPAATVEVSVVALPSPRYEIVEARGRAVAGHIDPRVLSGLETLGGVQMVGGFTRRVSEATGNGDGAGLVRDAMIEIARLARQVAKLPRERVERAMKGDPAACWELDREGFVDLPDSCFAYSAPGRGLFGTRAISCAMTPDLYSPRPGQQRVFVRQKIARLERRDGRLHLFHSMRDNVHGFELTYEIDLATGAIVRADSLTPRLPYAGVCSEPQRKIASLVGETLDAGLGKRIQGLIGGTSGCAQLYDLTSDLLRLLSPR